MDENARADGAAVGLYAFQFHLDPICLAAEVVPQERWRLVHVDDEYVDVTIIIEISKGAAPAAMRGGYSETCGVNKLFENTLAQISEYRAWRFIRVLGKPAFDFRVNVTGDHE